MASPVIVMGGDPEDWGYILTFLDSDDPRPAKEQINAHYVSGWHHFDGFTFDAEKVELTYPGDPPYKPISMALFRDELLVLWPSAWLQIFDANRNWEISRLD